MRTAIFLVVLSLNYIGDAIIIASGKTVESIPDVVINFLGVIFCVFIAMDIVDFFGGRKT